MRSIPSDWKFWPSFGPVLPWASEAPKTRDVRWAASACTWTLRATCFDKQAFASFIADHYQGADTEAACGGGLDLSASGWCP